MIYLLIRHLLSGEHYAYENPLFRATVAGLFCFLLMLIFGPAVIRVLVRKKLGTHVEFDHEQLNREMESKSNVPTMGGSAIMAAVVLATFLFADVLNFYVQMAIVAAIWLSVLGGMDDYLKLTAGRRVGSRHGLKGYEKLLFQIGLGVVLGYFVYSHGRTNFAVVGHVTDRETVEAYRILSVPFYKQGVLLSALAFMFMTVLVMAGTSNAVNLTDGMDGLASGCVALCGLVFAVLAYIVGDEGLAGKLLMPHVPKSGELAVICGSIVGACCGFLWYNCHPARMFMGDTGSLPLGGVIGYVAIVLRQELMLFIVGGVFVIEALSVILQVGYFKWTGGKRIFRVAPIHHHFQLGGWSETQTVVRFWLLAAMFTGLAFVTIKLR